MIISQSYVSFQSCAKANRIVHAPIQLIKGDFLTNSEVKAAISRAGLVYMNNAVFGADLNLKVLIELCPLMPLGCKLMCFDWTGLDCWPALLLRKRVIKLPKGAVSWTHNEIDLQVFERV